MTDETEGPLFTVDKVAAASTALRVALGLPPAHFGAAQFVGMVSDEIEALRAAGWDDAGIAALIRDATGEPLEADAVTRHYADPARRRS